MSMGVEDVLRLLDKKDLGVALTGGVVGYTFDAIFFASTGLPPGTIGGLVAAGSVGLKYLIGGGVHRTRLNQRSKRLYKLLKNSERPELADKINARHKLWKLKLLNNSDFDNEIREVIGEFLDTGFNTSELDDFLK